MLANDAPAPPELDSSRVARRATALPIAIEVFAPEGERVFANPAAAERAAHARRSAAPNARKRSATGAPC